MWNSYHSKTCSPYYYRGFFLCCLLVVVNHFCYTVIHFKEQDLTSLWLDNDVLVAIAVLLICVIAGAVVQGITHWMISEKKRERYQKLTGLYKPTRLLFDEVKNLQHYLPFFNKDCEEKFRKPYMMTAPGDMDICGMYFDHIFSYVLVSNKDAEMRVQQSFYFLFRHLFTCCVLVAMFSMAAFLLTWAAAGLRAAQPLLWITILCIGAAYFVFAPIGKRYRRKMVQHLFTEYYLLKNELISQ